MMPDETSRLCQKEQSQQIQDQEAVNKRQAQGNTKGRAVEAAKVSDRRWQWEANSRPGGCQDGVQRSSPGLGTLGAAKNWKWEHGGAFAGTSCLAWRVRARVTFSAGHRPTSLKGTTFYDTLYYPSGKAHFRGV